MVSRPTASMMRLSQGTISFLLGHQFNIKTMDGLDLNKLLLSAGPQSMVVALCIGWKTRSRVTRGQVPECVDLS